MKLISLQDNEDEMMTISSEQLNEATLPTEVLQTVFEMTHCIFMGLALSDKHFPKMMDNIKNTLKENLALSLEDKET